MTPAERQKNYRLRLGDAWRARHRERTRLAKLAETPEQRDTRLRKGREYYIRHAEKIKAYQREHNAFIRKSASEARLEAVKVRRRHLARERYAKNKEQIHQRLRSSPERLLASALRKRLNTAVKKNKFKRACKTMQMLGCSVPFLKDHLESLFKIGMDWSNYGYWHIDHIRPLSSFDLSIPAQQLEAFNWKNMQPLWQRENIIKSDSLVACQTIPTPLSSP